ncbi:MAG: hypothetical protein E6J71_07315 [Deltaproteobacteria bacterium]|nr:MAG: hypothetical protein E6J77_01720 [Deltaproteobacteria bacterium]TMB21889.1 MAG: hypothetical protein E6J71_07315 [Deltaproteobacteria bacterium]
MAETLPNPLPDALHVDHRAVPALRDYPAPDIDSQLLAADVEGGFFVVLLTTHRAEDLPGATAYMRSLTDLPGVLRQLGIA